MTEREKDKAVKEMIQNGARNNVVRWFERVEYNLETALEDLRRHKKSALLEIGEVKHGKEKKVARDTVNEIDCAVNMLQQVNFRFDEAVRTAASYSFAFDVDLW